MAWQILPPYIEITFNQRIDIDKCTRRTDL